MPWCVCVRACVRVCVCVCWSRSGPRTSVFQLTWFWGLCVISSCGGKRTTTGSESLAQSSTQCTVYSDTHTTHTHTQACMHAHMYTCTHTHTQWTHICIPLHMYVQHHICNKYSVPTVHGCTRWHSSAEQTSPESETGQRSSEQPSMNVSYRPGRLPTLNT